jgi:predicted Zn-dependent peptidase
VRVARKKTEQAQIALGIRTCSRHDPRRFALRLMNAVLGENMSSRLFQIVREEKALAYSIYSTPSFFDDTGDLVVYAGLDAGNVAKAVKLILHEMRELAEHPPVADELRRARDYVAGQIDLGSESTENQMNIMGEQLLAYGNVHTAAQVKRHLSRVTGAEIQSAARDFFRPEHLNLAMVTQEGDAAGLEKLLGEKDRW